MQFVQTLLWANYIINIQQQMLKTFLLVMLVSQIISSSEINNNQQTINELRTKQNLMINKVKKQDENNKQPTIQFKSASQKQQNLAVTNKIYNKEKLYCSKSLNKSVFPNLSHPSQFMNAQRQMLVQTIYGFQVYVDTFDSTVSKSIANTGTWQSSMIAVIAYLVQPGYKVLNVGSHIGLEAVIMGKIIGEEGNLFVIEPYSFSYQLMSKNININNLSDITKTYKVGASNKQGTGIIEVNIANTGASSINQKNKNKIEDNRQSKQIKKLNHFFKQSQQVVLSKIDALIPPQISLDFALIDVQKMEIPVMLGMKEIISRSPNLVIMVEWQYGLNPKSDRYQTEKFLQFMLQNNYKIYRYIKSADTGEDNCGLGRFVQFRKIQTLFHINIMQIFMFPKSKWPQ